MASKPVSGLSLSEEDFRPAFRRGYRMKGNSMTGIAPIIIYHNVREEFHLTLVKENGDKFIDLRTCIRDPKREKAVPTGNGITINLDLWPHFIAAVSSPETWVEPLPFWNKPRTREFARGRLIFPEEALQKIQQEQIFLEHKNFQGIPFIFLSNVARTTRGRHLSMVTIGPLLWSQFMRGLAKMEEALIDLGWLSGQAGEKQKSRNLSLI
jgi:hypothetical protein